MPYGLTDKQRETTAIQQLPEVTVEADEVFATMRDGQRPTSIRFAGEDRFRGGR